MQCGYASSRDLAGAAAEALTRQSKTMLGNYCPSRHKPPTDPGLRDSEEYLHIRVDNALPDKSGTAMVGITPHQA